MLALLACVYAAPAAAATTYGHDNARTGWYPDQDTLTPQLVTGGTFGKLFDTAIDGQVYAQPLVSNDTLFVATESNNVYGMNPRTGAVRWSRHVGGTPWNAADLSCADLTPSIGVTGTPVIDPSGTGTAYFFAKSYVSGGSGAARWDAHAVDLSTGDERPGFPVQISGTADNNPLTSFNAAHEMQRPGLLLMDGVVYAAFGGHCDRAPFQGWVVGVSTAGQVKAKWVALGGQNGAGAGIWQSGGGIVSDGPGRLFVATGNGGSPPVGTPGTSPPSNLGQSDIRLAVQPDGTLAAADFFAPYDAAKLDGWDADLASGGPIALPAQFGSQAHPKLLLQYGKQGYMYLVDRDDMGGIGMGPNGADKVVARLGNYGGIWSTPAIWPGDGGYMYVPTTSGATETEVFGGSFRTFKFGTTPGGQPTLSPAAESTDTFGFGSGTPVVTSSGTTSGSALVWIVWTGAGNGVGAQLRAYAPVPQNGRPVLLWSAPVGTSSKFAAPGVAGGRIYVGTRDGHVLAFGSPVTPPLTAPSAAFPTTTTGSSSQRTVHLTAAHAVTVTGVSTTPSQFSVQQLAAPVTLAAGQSLDVPVTFTPAAATTYGGTLKVTTASDGDVTVGLSGTGAAAAAQLSVDRQAISFEGTRVGGQVNDAFTISNVGGQSLTINSMTEPQAPFSTPASLDGDSLGPGESVTVEVDYEPKSAGSFAQDITIDTTAGDELVGLSGTAADGPHLDITPLEIDYGDALPGSVVTRSFTLRNSGGTTATIMKSKPPVGGVFVATSQLDETTKLGPGAERTLTVEFRPAAAGAASDAWDITADDDSGPQQVSFRGRGVAPPADSPSQTQAPAQTRVSPPPVAPVLLPAIARDPLAVTLTRLRLDARHRRVSFRLSRAAHVVLRIERLVRCRSAIGRCFDYARAGRAVKVRGRAGSNAVRLPRRRLRAGRYRLSAAPAGARPRAVAFRVRR